MPCFFAKSIACKCKEKIYGFKILPTEISSLKKVAIDFMKKMDSNNAKKHYFYYLNN